MFKLNSRKNGGRERQLIHPKQENRRRNSDRTNAMRKSVLPWSQDYEFRDDPKVKKWINKAEVNEMKNL